MRGAGGARGRGETASALSAMALPCPARQVAADHGKIRVESAGSGSRAISAAPGPPRLVFLLQDLAFGGTQRQALELARRLDPAGFRVEVWVLAAGEGLVPMARRHGIPVVGLGAQEQVGPAALTRLWRRLCTRPIDILMPLTVVPNVWGRVLGRLARVPLVIGNCRGGGAPGRQHERWLWPLAHHILCNSQAVKSVLISRCGVPAARLSVIPNGVDTEYFQPVAQAVPNPLTLLCVARMAPDKDHETLLQAFCLAAPAHPEAELWLVGDGPGLTALQDLSRRLGLREKVRFLAPREDLRPLLQRAALLVLSSKAEALPNVVLEAMAAGLPVVATRVGGVPELVVPDKTGWLAPPENPPSLAAAISQALADPDTRRAFGRAGRERACREFSLETMARRYETMFRYLLDQVRR